jgi:hypothetical protein
MHPIVAFFRRHEVANFSNNTVEEREADSEILSSWTSIATTNHPNPRIFNPILSIVFVLERPTHPNPTLLVQVPRLRLYMEYIHTDTDIPVRSAATVRQVKNIKIGHEQYHVKEKRKHIRSYEPIRS